MSVDGRRHFHNDLRDLELHVQTMGAAAQDRVNTSLQALATSDKSLCDEVVQGDDEIDAHYMAIEEKVLDLFALQNPVASDLRILTVILHVNVHLERIADMAVNVAKITGLAADLPSSPVVLGHLREMGDIALSMLGAAMEAFAKRDLELCLKLPVMDDPIDRLNRGMLKEVLVLSGDQRMLEWGMRMQVVARQLERIGDHAVDIGEQVAFLVTGEFREFTDASD